MRETEIDTIRVISCLLVVFAHFAVAIPLPNAMWAHISPAGWGGALGVILFFGISGYLMGNTLDKKDTLSNFYKKKLIRMIIPWFVAYWFMSFIWLVIGLLNSSYLELTPISYYLWNPASISELLRLFIFMIPYENNIASLLNGSGWFIGEWFVGTLIILYAISPVLHKISRSRLAIVFLCVFMLIGCISFYLTKEIMVQPWWFFIPRIPEYLLGMILFRNKIYFTSRAIRYYMAFMLLIGSFITISYYNYTPNYIDRLFMLHPLSYCVSLPAIYFSFFIAKKIQSFSAVIYLNKLAPFGYSIILLQHTIIFGIAKHIYLPTLNGRGFIMFLVLDVIITLFFAQILYRTYSPIEKFALQCCIKK